MEINNLERAELLRDYAEMMELLIKHPYQCSSPHDYDINNRRIEEMYLAFTIQCTLDMFKLIKDANFDYIKDVNYQDIYEFAKELNHQVTFLPPNNSNNLSLKSTTNAMRKAICHHAYKIYTDGTIEFNLQEAGKPPFVAKTNIAFIFGLALDMMKTSENFELIEPITDSDNPILDDIIWQRYYGRNSMNANPRFVGILTGFPPELIRKKIIEHIHDDAITGDIKYYTFELEDYEKDYIEHYIKKPLDLNEVYLAFNKISRINWRNQFLQKYYLIGLCRLQLANLQKSNKSIEHRIFDTEFGHYLLDEALNLGIDINYLYDFYQDHQQNINHIYGTYFSFIFTELDQLSFTQSEINEIEDITGITNYQFDYLIEKLRNCFTHGRYSIDDQDIFYLRDHANGQRNEQDPNFELNISRSDLLAIASIMHNKLNINQTKTRVRK